MSKVIPIKKYGAVTTGGTLAIGVTSISLSTLPTQQSGYLVLDYDVDGKAEEVSFSHSGSNPVTISATTIEHSGTCNWCIDNTNGYYQEKADKTGGDIVSPAFKGVITGWIAANETITCGADNVLTASSALVSNLNIGDKIWIKDDSTDWMGYIISKPTGTTFGIVGGTTSGAAATVANGSTITVPYYSKVSSPAGFPHWFNYVPTLVGFSSNPGGIYRFSINGRVVNLNVRSYSDGTSNANNYTITPPVNAPALSNQAYSTQIGVSVNNGSQTTSRDIVYYEPASSQVIQLALNGSTTGWATSNGKRATFQMIYEI